MAALQVVYRRLQEAHLGDFCLPLHSYKANKKEILEQIGANLKLKQTRVKDAAMTNLEELSAICQELNQYVYELHKPNSELNISCYEVYSKLEEVNDALTIVFSLEDPLFFLRIISALILSGNKYLWHYRSKHEDLIAFSNREIYNNELITFPNSIVKVPDMGVEYFYVEDGCYEGGGKTVTSKRRKNVLC